MSVLKNDELIFNLIKIGLWDESIILPSSVDWKLLYDFFNEHAILPLTANCMDRIVISEKIKPAWKERVLQQIYHYYSIVRVQNKLLESLNGLNVVVIKGTSAAKYYPKPHLRTMGDIDLLVKPEDYEASVCRLLSIGCVEITCQAELELGRHRSFRYKDVTIELHRFFSLYVDEDKGNVLDDLLFDAIAADESELPDVENGLVILSHIRQHLEDGIGLRQIIDWMMFVNSCLDDHLWHESFQKKAQRTGLEQLAITVTKMCQKYLGLTTSNITWCRIADDELCEYLMQYIMECGNFGRTREILQSGGASKIPSIYHPLQLFKYIQKRGEKNWRVINKHPLLKPFAWVYQSCRYIKIAVRNRVGAKKLRDIYGEGDKRNEMYIALGLK